MIRLENIRKSFGDNTVLDGISFDIEKGDVVAIIGPSGTGNPHCYAASICWRPRMKGKLPSMILNWIIRK